MHQFAIRCHPYSPITTGDVDDWLHAEVERLRERAPQAALRLLRLTQAFPTGDAEVGWLIEFDATGEETTLDDDDLARILRDLRLLGLQPTLLQAGVMAGSDFAANGTGR
jgi:hypothetical protein